MSFTNLLTIAMPCYERTEFFLEALESALNQTVKCKVIVVDNCSSHNYFEKICKEKGVTYYRNVKNIGLYANYNRSYDLSNTEYVKILDDDDILSPEYVESFIKAIELHPDIDVFFSDYSILTSNGKKSHKFILPFGYIENGLKIIEYGIKYKLGFPYMSCAIKKAKIHCDNEIEGNIGGFDWEWIYSKADMFSFYGDTNKLYTFRIHKKQTSYNDWAIYRLTLPYIYDKVLLEKVSDPKLKKKISKNSFWEFICLKSNSNDAEIRKILHGNNKYDKYLKDKLKENFLLNIFFILPKGLAHVIFKVLRKTTFAD